MQNTNVRILMVLLLFVSIAAYAAATANVPAGPESVSVVQTERKPIRTAQPIEAEAGNVTELFVNGTTQTMHWQGFYGNITGTITLDDAQNNTMYDWHLAEPQGEIYASTDSAVSWSSISCLNATSSYSISTLEASIGLDTTSVDGVDETFCSTCNASETTPHVNHKTFWVGTVTIPANSCPATALYVNDAPQTTDFVEVLLQDGDAPVYTSIIEDDQPNTEDGKIGFDGLNHDFQMIVGENGTDGDDLTTTYYFYVELE